MRPLESQLRSSVRDLDVLWAAIHKTRDTTRTLIVDRDALARVLVDHSLMAHSLWGSKVNPNALRAVKE